MSILTRKDLEFEEDEIPVEDEQFEPWTAEFKARGFQEWDAVILCCWVSISAGILWMSVNL